MRGDKTMWRIGTTVCLAAATVLIVWCRPAFSQQPAAPDEQICDVRADAALGLEDYPTAIKLHQYLLRSHPNDALAHYHLGFAYGMVGRSAEEIDEYQKAVTLGLHNWDLFLNLGMAYVAQGELADAAEALEYAALRAPERPETHFNLALVYEAEHRLSEALKEITIARRLSPDDQDIENTNAVLCAEMGDVHCARMLWTHLAQAGYSPARANLAILTRITSPGRNLSPLIERPPLVTEQQHAMGKSCED
jgi:Flp pilus assembly protein TadD